MGDAFIRSFYGPITEHEACGRRHGNNVSVVLTGLPLLLFLYLLLLLLFLFSYSSLLLLRSLPPLSPTVQQPTFSLFRRVVLSVRETARRFVPDETSRRDSLGDGNDVERSRRRTKRRRARGGNSRLLVFVSRILVRGRKPITGITRELCKL